MNLKFWNYYFNGPNWSSFIFVLRQKFVNILETKVPTLSQLCLQTGEFYVGRGKKIGNKLSLTKPITSSIKSPENRDIPVGLFLWNTNKGLKNGRKSTLKRKIIKGINADINCLIEPHSEVTISNSYKHVFSIPVVKSQSKINCTLVIKDDIAHKVVKLR